MYSIIFLIAKLTLKFYILSYILYTKWSLTPNRSDKDTILNVCVETFWVIKPYTFLIIHIKN